MITKVDSKTGEKLSGAVFMITNTTTKQSLTGTTGKDGTLTFKDLHAGYWKIVEIAPPAGYYAEKDYMLVPLLGKDQSVTIGNLKNPPIDPPKGNNIVWGYELNRSFTNDTNFSNLVNWNTLAEHTVNGCSDGGTTRYVASILFPLETSIPTAFISVAPFHSISFKLAAIVSSLPIQIAWSHEHPEVSVVQPASTERHSGRMADCLAAGHD